MRDIRLERRRTPVLSLEQALRASDEILELLPVATCICDLEGRIVQYNRRAVEIWMKQWMAKIFLGGAPEAVRLLFLFFGIGAVSWLTMARIVRGEVLSLRTRQFVDASRALGAGHAQLLFRHILPNISGVIIVYLALTVPSVILYESFLSYLGLGIQPPMASWGSLIADGAQQINPIRIYWWLLVFPAGVLTATLLALSFLGDGLRDALDPRANR